MPVDVKIFATSYTYGYVVHIMFHLYVFTTKVVRKFKKKFILRLKKQVRKKFANDVLIEIPTHTCRYCKHVRNQACGNDF